MFQKNIWQGLIVALALTTIVFAQTSKKPINNSEIRTEKAIQRAVRDYFNWQYASIKDGIRQSANLKPSASSDKAQDFLRKKQDYLEVFEYSNEVNGIVIAEQSFSLAFSDLSFSESQTASVEILENYERRYEYSDESARGSISHRIYLQWNGKNWEVIDDEIRGTDAPPTNFDKYNLMEEIRQQSLIKKQAEQDFLQKSGITQEFLEAETKQLTEQGLDLKQVDEKLKEIVNQKANDYLSQMDFSNGFGQNLYTNRGYNRANAQSYINSWWNRRNPAWGNFDNLGGDCTNWTSQIIYAGGIPKDTGGSYQWYYNSMNSRSPSWTGVKEFWSYLVGNSQNDGYYGPQASYWYNSTGHANMSTGDVIQLSSSSGWFHTYGVYRTEWVKQCPWYNPFCSTWVYKVYITSHYADRINEDINVVASSYPTRRYARIVGWRAP